ncbi:phospholipase A [Variovorax saccharolyticus]|uniref:phospholipase A n=1 Tax=Variovorax saccharolyticus TaxID=3053516 RepID=UPI002575525C|nr:MULTISPECIES: phospholipase A [unclassified Variovorax]MDM0019638.1 phospholipase A [Variovorax sp. J22R187]MDM0027790.1 phospholipase A [Variovorax sp. J31P216]
MNKRILFFTALVTGIGAAGVQAQAVDKPSSPLADSELTWQQCQRLAGSGNNEARLACFDRWAQQQTLPGTSVPVAPPVLAETQPPVDATIPATRVVTVATEDGCRDRQYSPLSRFWELEAGSNCGTLGFRGYRPLSVGIGVAANDPETATSPAIGRTGVDRPYQAQDMRIGLSLRTKLAQGLLTGDDPVKKDGLWFAYSQASTWQVFNSELSRPFRTTDHEPEFIYSYPTDFDLGGGWRMRYAGLGLVHQSNGQDLPYSRSWNRVYLMGGAELGDKFVITGRIWSRISENANDDDNPDITKYLGHAEVRGAWQVDRLNQVGVTVRGGKGSIRLEWFKAIGDPVKSNLRIQAQLFHGYGDTLVDYNRKRTVFSVGLALVDF